MLDTEILYTEVGHQIIAAYSRLAEPAERLIDSPFKLQLMGRKKLDCAQMMVDRFRLDMSVEDYIALSFQMEGAIFRTCKELPGASAVVEALVANGTPLALATGSSGCMFKIKSGAHAGLFKHFSAIVTGDDKAVEKGKPAPDIFLEAARRIHVDPKAHGACLVVEDSPNGVLAGLAAGMQVAWVPAAEFDVHTSHPELAAHPRVSVFASLSELHRAILA